MIMECIGFNWLCKHMKKVTSIQAAILVLKWVKQFFPVSIVKSLEPIRFQKAVPLICVISLPLHKWQNILYFTYVLFFLPWGGSQWNRSCQKQVYNFSLKMGELLGKHLLCSLKNISQKIFCWLPLTFP